MKLPNRDTDWESIARGLDANDRATSFRPTDQSCSIGDPGVNKVG